MDMEGDSTGKSSEYYKFEDDELNAFAKKLAHNGADQVIQLCE